MTAVKWILSIKGGQLWENSESSIYIIDPFCKVNFAHLHHVLLIDRVMDTRKRSSLGSESSDDDGSDSEYVSSDGDDSYSENHDWDADDLRFLPSDDENQRSMLRQYKCEKKTKTNFQEAKNESTS